MNQGVISVLSLIGLLGVAFFSVEITRKLNEGNEYALRRRLEAPHRDKIPRSFLVRALADICKDIYDVTDNLIANSNVHQVIS